MQKLEEISNFEGRIGVLNSEIIYNNLSSNAYKRSSQPFTQHFVIGGINYDSPISYLLKVFYRKDINSYIYHKEIQGSDPNSDKNYIFILKDDILITSIFEGINYSDFSFIKTNPIIMKIEYKNVK